MAHGATEAERCRSFARPSWQKVRQWCQEMANSRVCLPTCRRTMPLCLGAAACQLAIRCAVSLLPRSGGGNLRFLLIDAAKPDIAVGPCWASRHRPAIYLRVSGRACDECYEPCKCRAHKPVASKGG